MRYTVSAKVKKKGKPGEREIYQIETDTMARAIHLANVFRNNQWEEVKIEVGGKDYSYPWGNVP